MMFMINHKLNKKFAIALGALIAFGGSLNAPISAMECTESEARKKLNELLNESLNKINEKYEYLSIRNVEDILSNISFYRNRAGALTDEEQRNLKLTILKFRGSIRFCLSSF